MIFGIVLGSVLMNGSLAWALIPVVPFTPEEYLDVVTGPDNCGLSCQTNTSLLVPNASTNLSVTSSAPSGSASIDLTAAGLPDLSVFAGNTAGTSTNATASYINTIRFVYTGAGPAPATLTSAIGWTVAATILSPPGMPSGEVGGAASIAISLSSCSCPARYASVQIGQTGSYALSNPFTIPDGGSIAYEAGLSAYVYGSSTLTGSSSLDPALSITLPPGWTGYPGSGGILGEPAVAATPEPSSLLLLLPFFGGWAMWTLSGGFRRWGW
jgi:hypothetical protein